MTGRQPFVPNSHRDDVKLSTRIRDAGPDRGSLIWAVLISLIVLSLGTIFTASVITTVHRSKASTDAMMLTQYTDTAVADAIAVLNAGDPVPSTLDTAGAKCEKVAERSMCYRYWALPVPGTALDPVRYDLVSRVWIDDGSMTEPDGGLLVRSVKLPLEVITYQTTAGVGPVLNDGYVSYNPTPAGLFANAIHSFTSTTLEGPDLSVKSYNSQTGDTGTRNATVSSSGWISFGAATQADRTVLYGGASAAGDHTSRCTGEACEESGTRVVKATYAPPTEVSVAWMRTVGATECVNTYDGDWLTSEHGNQLPAGASCINGSLLVDSATTTASPLTTVYVNGTVMVRDSLNAPALGTLASPASLVIYTTGGVVSFDTPAGAGVAALIYAPLATCGTNPGSTNQITYFGSLVCGTISLGGSWAQLYDEAAVAEYIDPVPGAAKTFSPGVAVAVDFDKFHVPSGWTANACVLAPPAGSGGYWKLDEAAGVLARDSSGSGMDAGWTSGAADGRTDGVCGKAALLRSGGALRGAKSASSIPGVTVDYWAKGLVGTAVDVAGVKVTHDGIRHVSVTVGASTVRIPFSVENYSAWHEFVVTVSAAGQVTLYVDGGLAKGTVASGVTTAAVSGPVTIGDGTSTGAIDEVVYYPTPLTQTQVSDRWTWWTTTLATKNPTFSATDPGVPFSVPGAVANNASGPTTLAMKWTTPTGNFPVADPTVSYRVEMADLAAGPWVSFGTAAATSTTFTQSVPAPPPGTHFYRVCAIYNGDTKCSGGVSILTLPVPVAPVVSVAGVTTTMSFYSWTAPAYAAGYESRYQINYGAWSGVIDESANLSRSHGPTTQGSRIGIQVRAINAAGTSPWSNVGDALLLVSGPTATGWISSGGNTGAGDWSLNSRVTGVTCPAGTTAQSQFVDQGTNWGGAWNGWSGWGWTDAQANGWTRNHASWIGSYDVGARQKVNIKCVNPASGAESWVSGEHGPIELWHAVPGPWGSWAGIIAYRTAGWGAACSSQLTPVYQWQVAGNVFDTGVQGWTFGTSWANTGQAWGRGAVWMTAKCEAPGGRQSGTQSASEAFG